MPLRPTAALLASAVLLALAAVGPCTEREVRQQLVSQPGFVEPHTPGAPAAPPASAAVETLLGPAPDLNRVTTQRLFLDKPGGAPPRAVLILVPGFLGGASTLSPLARQLVQRFNGELQVWLVDRRPNQLEDRLGAAHARSAFPDDGPSEPARLVEGVQFYFADEGEFDVDQDGELDPAFPLEDAFGVQRPFLRLAQDDVRFMAHWGLDTYARDWRILVAEARALVGESGLVLFGGHSMGTGWTARFAAYDFDPGPGVDASYLHLDGLLLLEGGGAGPPSAGAADLVVYRDMVASLEAPGGPDVYLTELVGIDVPGLGAAGELAGIAGLNLPEGPSIVQRTSLFGSFPLGIVLGSPASNEAVIGLFIDDDFSSLASFRASLGFSSNGPNLLQPGLFGGPPFYIAAPAEDGGIRRWQGIDDPALPRCPPNQPDVSPGCAIQEGQVEVTAMEDFLALQFDDTNFVEWYFVDGRVNLDFAYGRDSSALGDESLLAVTQNAAVDVPVLAIGGSNGLTPTAASFAGYLGSIATPEERKEVAIIPGYAHLDVITARSNAAVPVIADWINRLLFF